MKACGEEDFRANLMRNIVGSVGTAVATTMTARGTQNSRACSAGMATPTTCKVSGCSTASAQPRWRKDPTYAHTAGLCSYVWLGAEAAALLSYLNAFWFFGMVFLLMLPLIFLMKKPSHGVGTARLCVKGLGGADERKIE
jgi:hypothetical protein